MHFVPLSDVFYRLAAFHAFHEFAKQPEGTTADDIEAAASYCDKLASYKEHLVGVFVGRVLMEAFSRVGTG